MSIFNCILAFISVKIASGALPSKQTLIKEVDFAGHEICYYVFLDLQTPIIDFEAKIYGKEKNKRV